LSGGELAVEAGFLHLPGFKGRRLGVGERGRHAAR
jgi:hypothetical protein